MKNNSSTIRYRKVGNTEIDVSEIGFGTWQVGGKDE